MTLSDTTGGQNFPKVNYVVSKVSAKLLFQSGET